MESSSPFQNSDFSKAEYERYSRHLIIPEFNLKGQAALKASRVLVIGAGGLGCPILQYLTAAGIGTIGILDFDQVSLSNLQRQILYDVSQVGEKKVTAAKAKLAALNPHVQFKTHDTQITADNALELIANYDLVIDGTDNFPTRYLVNDACVLADKPLIYGSIFQFEGQVSVFNLKLPDGSYGPNYRDLFPTPPPPDLVPNCAEGGVLGVLPGIVGSLQANEAIKVLTGIGDPLSGRLYVFDALSFTSVTLNVRSHPDGHPITELIDYESFCNVDQTESASTEVREITATTLKTWLDQKKSFQLVDVRNPYEYEIVNLRGHLIPLNQLPEKHGEIQRSGPVVLHCRTGKRSAEALRLLSQEFGFDNLLNLKGGIVAYAEEIDQSLPIY